ncbi:hypothetical protein DAEQUDRAFT_771040 [Daedalea quercina L-15889]|uniref:Retrotransposon gag domain-containing protein n=1 Tax=Daedalea quercina L-15889 TaxID=1314783 RepID=A0A165KEA7_9APHY|nr:hypothetical protein DAEQUDRAFT_771040 [Daedalea quercina L-15889]
MSEGTSTAGPTTSPSTPGLTLKDLRNLAQALAGTGLRSKLDVPRPTDFEGTGEDVHPFLQRVNEYFRTSGNHALPEDQKVAYAISLMNKGAGKTWRDTYFVVGNTIGTWSEYTDTLKSAFHVYDAEGTNLLSLFGFKQGNKSTTKFITKFVALYMKAGLRDTEFKEDGSMKEAHDARTLITLFQTGIRADLFKVEDTPTPPPPPPVTLTPWM